MALIETNCMCAKPTIPKISEIRGKIQLGDFANELSY